ncbi:hypothetical protein XELAEV_18046801mg, partial [Xenopus laevis]
YDTICAWWRYIDDVFLLWRGDLDSLAAFRDAINGAHNDIKFTMTADLQAVTFLDVLVTRTQTGFDTHVYTKPTDRNQLLSYDSFHPASVKRSIPISQFTRVSRITNNPVSLEQDLELMSRKLRDRGYPSELIQKNQQSVREGNLRGPSRDRGTMGNRLAYVSQYNSASPKFKSILDKHWHLLREAYPSILEFQQGPMMSYHRGVTIGSRLVNADIRTPPKKAMFWGPRKEGMYRCKGCAQCRYVLVGPEFDHPHRDQKYQIRGFNTCDTNFAVYMLVCPCGLVYVGETTQKVKDRFSQHRSTIHTGNRSLPVSRHCLEKGHTSDELKFRVIQHVPPLKRGGDRALALKRAEVKWIDRLGTLSPQGLNRDFDLHLFL